MQLARPGSVATGPSSCSWYRTETQVRGGGATTERTHKREEKAPLQNENIGTRRKRGNGMETQARGGSGTAERKYAFGQETVCQQWNGVNRIGNSGVERRTYPLTATMEKYIKYLEL